MRGPTFLVFMVVSAACGDGSGAGMDAAALKGEWTFLFEELEGAPRIIITGDVDERLAVTGQWWEVEGRVLYEGGCSGTLEGQRLE